MFKSVYNDYSDDSVNITIKTKEVSAQEAADFYTKHLDYFKSKIIDSGEFNTFGVTSKWITYPDHHTDDINLYTEFKINERVFKFDSKLCMGVMRRSDLVETQAHIKDKIVNKLTNLLKDEILKNGTDAILSVIKDAKRIPY